MLAGGWLAVKTILERGPTITISFKTGEGLEAGKTKIKYRDVDIGLVKKIALTADRKQVVATAEFARTPRPPRRGHPVLGRCGRGSPASGVSGLGTLLSGPHIVVDPGRGKGAAGHFVALDVPPIVTQ